MSDKQLGAWVWLKTGAQVYFRIAAEAAEMVNSYLYHSLEGTHRETLRFGESPKITAILPDQIAAYQIGEFGVSQASLQEQMLREVQKMTRDVTRGDDWRDGDE